MILWKVHLGGLLDHVAANSLQTFSVKRLHGKVTMSHNVSAVRTSYVDNGQSG